MRHVHAGWLAAAMVGGMAAWADAQTPERIEPPVGQSWQPASESSFDDYLGPKCSACGQCGAVCCCPRHMAEVGYFNCRCRGSYKFPVPPRFTYHWPGMYSQQTMTEHVGPYRNVSLIPPGSYTPQAYSKRPRSVTTQPDPSQHSLRPALNPTPRR